MCGRTTCVKIVFTGRPSGSIQLAFILKLSFLTEVAIARKFRITGHEYEWTQNVTVICMSMSTV